MNTGDIAMDTRMHDMAKRLLLSAAAAAALSGCAVYDSPYPAYGGAAVATPYYAPYYSSYYSPYYYGYGVYPYRYGWGGPPVALNFNYYQHRYHGGPGWRGPRAGGPPYSRGHAWGGSRPGGAHEGP